MGIRSRLRRVFPPTNRFFESSIRSVRDDIASIRSDELRRIEELRMESVEAMKELTARLDESNARLASLDQRLLRLEKKTASLSYANMEYALPVADGALSGRVLLVGWYGADNCGDELMLRSILKHFKGKNTRVTVLLWDYMHYDPSDLPEFVDTLHYPSNTWHLRQLVSSFDVLVWGGGAILDDLQYTDDPFNFNTGNLFIRLSSMMHDEGKSVYSLGLSSNAVFTSEGYINKLARIVSESEYFSLRDEHSFRTFQNAGIDMSKVHLCEDVVFGDPDIKSVVPVQNSGNGRLLVGVVLFCSEEHTEHNVCLLTALADYACKRNIDLDVRLIPFFDCYGADRRYLEMISDRVDLPNRLSIGEYSSSLEDNEIFNCDAVICYRYHAALLAGAKGIRSLFVCNDSHPHYPNKIAHLAKLFDYEDNVVDESALNESNFELYFDRLFAPAPAPNVRAGLFEETCEWLESVCSSIASSVKTSEKMISDSWLK